MCYITNMADEQPVSNGAISLGSLIRIISLVIVVIVTTAGAVYAFSSKVDSDYVDRIDLRVQQIERIEAANQAATRYIVDRLNEIKAQLDEQNHRLSEIEKKVE